MSSNPPASPPSADELKNQSFTALNALKATAIAAANNPANPKEAQDAAFELLTAVTDQIDALDQTVFTGNTVQLQAAEATTKSACEQLKVLEARIKAIGARIQEGAEIVAGIGTAVSKLMALGML